MLLRFQDRERSFKAGIAAESKECVLWEVGVEAVTCPAGEA